MSLRRLCARSSGVRGKSGPCMLMRTSVKGIAVESSKDGSWGAGWWGVLHGKSYTNWERRAGD